MSNGLLIIGAGGHGKVVADAARQQGKWARLAFLDDNPRLAGPILGLPLLGGSQAAAGLRREYADVVVAIGNADRRLGLIEELGRQGFELPVIQHPSASISPFATLQEGCVVFAQSAINADTVLGRGCIVNTGATVDHDCILADGVHVSPGAHLAGGVRVGRSSWIGIGACVRENIVVGDGVTVAAGAAVIADIENKLTVAGVPAAAIPRPGAQS
jgi:sugar O-acyltransferase (sialic acid O-acetyltransferase NeuD family)